MDISSVILGTGMATIFFIVSYFIYRILQNFEENKEVSLEMFLLDKRIKRGFKVLSISYIILVFVLSVEIMGFITEARDLQNTARTVMFLPLLGAIYFFYMIRLGTQKPSEKVKE